MRADTQQIIISRRDLKRTLAAAVLAAACGGVFAPMAAADTIHRYTFNDGTANDTGTLAASGLTDGVLRNGATITNGQLVTTEVGSGAANTTPDVSLGLFVASDLGNGSFSLTSYFTRAANATNTFTTQYSFSDGTTNNYVLASPGRGDGTNQYGFALKQAGVNGGAEVLLRGGVLAPGSTNMSVGTFNSTTGQATLFINGVAVAQSAAGALTGLNIGNLGTKIGINGNGPFADKALGGSTDDFRIDNAALTATQVATNFLAGPNNAVAVDTNTGTGSGDYNDAALWSLGTPTASQIVVVNNTKTLASGTGLAGILRVNTGGTLNITGGTLAPATNLDLVTGSTVNLTGGTLSLRGITVDGDLTSADNGPHTINLGGGTLQAAGNFLAPAQNITLNVNTASTVDSQAFSMSLPGTVTGTAAINKTGTGTAVFTGNTAAYTGAINVANGTFGISLPAGRTGANAFGNPINLDPAGAGTAAGFTIGQTNATDVTSVVTLGQPSVATTYAITATSPTNQNGNFIGRVTGGNANTTLSLTGFFKFDAPASDFVGSVQINPNTAIALAGPNSLGGTARTLISNGGGIEPQTATSLVGANRFVNPISVLANQAIYFTGNNPIEVGSTITGTLAAGVSVSDIQKSGAGTVTLSGTSTNIRNVVLNGAGGTAANPRVFQFASNFAGANPSTATVRGGIVDDNQGGNNDVQYVDLTGGVTVSNLVLASKGRSLAATPAVAGLVLNSSSGNNTWAGGLQIVNGGGGHRVNVAAGSTLTVGGVVNNNVGGGNRGYELTGAGNGTFTGQLLDNTYYVATPAASQLGVIMVGETTGTTLTNNGSWSINSTGNTLSGGLQVLGGRLNVNGSTTNTSTNVSNRAFVYGGTLGGTGSVSQPVTVYAPGVTITQGAFAAAGTTNPFLPLLSINPAATSFTTGGGTIDPGTSANAVGTLTLTSALTINGTYAAQLDGTGAGTADRLAVTGGLTLGNASFLNLSSLTTPDDALYVLATYASLSGTFGTVTGLPAGYTLNYGATQLTLTGTAAPTPTALFFTGATSGSLNAAGNYATDAAGATASTAAPGGVTNVTFASTNAQNLATATVASNLSVNSLTFGSGAAAGTAVTLSGPGTLTINAGSGSAGVGITKPAGSAAVTISAPIAVAASQSWTNNGVSALTVGQVALGTNTLTIAGSGPTNLTGPLGGSGSLVKTGSGTLRATQPAYATVLNGTGGIDVRGGAFVLDYAGAASPLAQVKAILTAGYNQSTKFSAGQIRGTTPAGQTLGYGQTGNNTVTVLATLPGDATLDGQVNFADFVALQGNFGASGVTFAQGDFDYNDAVNFADFVLLQSNFGQTATGGRASFTREEYAAVMSIMSASQVPEPASLAVLGLSAAGLLRRRRAVTN